MNPNASEPQRPALEEIFEAPRLDTAPPGVPSVVRGLIVDLLETGEIEVVVPPDPTTRIRCDFLESPQNSALELHPGDLVLMMRPAGYGQNGCVLGRVGRYRGPQAAPNQPPAHVALEAAETLTLKCGDGSVELRKDGKVLIKGKDLVSHAKRVNRIKGGSVAIN